MNFSTKTKIFIASVISKPFVWFVKSIFDSKITNVKRKGIYWELDLDEGIDFSIFIFGFFEKETSRALDRLVNKGSVVIDIGANIGAHTLPLARLVGKKGKVYAIEPTKYAYRKLIKNLSLNNDINNNVCADQVMLISAENTIKTNSVYSSWPLNKVNKNKRHSVHQGVLMTVDGSEEKTLDDYISNNNIRSLDLIKMDVDGNELSVVKGANKVLTKFKPIIVMELAPDQYNDRNDFIEVINILSNIGYHYYSLDESKQYPTNPNQLIRKIPENGSINIIARMN